MAADRNRGEAQYNRLTVIELYAARDGEHLTNHGLLAVTRFLEFSVGATWGIRRQNALTQKAVQLRIKLGIGSEEPQHSFGVVPKVVLEHLEQRPSIEEELFKFTKRQRLLGLKFSRAGECTSSVFIDHSVANGEPVE